MGTAPQTALSSVLHPPVNVLGDDMAAPRQLYFAFFPPLLVLAGLIGWAMGDESGMLLTAAVGTAVALCTLWDWLIRHGPTRIATLLGMTLLLGYCGGALNTWFTLPRVGSVSDWFGVDEGILARGMAAVLISSAFLYFLGELYEKPIFGREFRFHFDRRTRIVIYLGTVAILAGYATHSLGFEGVTNTATHVSIPGVLLSWLFAPLTAFAVASFLTATVERDRIFSGICTIILLATFTVVGRRNAVYTVIEILFVLGLTGFRWRQRMFRNLLLLILLIGVVVGSSLSFMLLRIAADRGGAAAGHRGEPSVGQRFRLASKMVRKGRALATASKATQENVESRTFVISFLASILDASFRTTPALGADAIGLTQLAIPRVFYPDKNVAFNEEGLVDYQFSFSFGDQPNSILTAGATDFGLIGMVLYPLFLVAITRVIISFMARRVKLVPLLFVVLSLIGCMLATEDSLTGYLESFRDTILLGFAMAIIFALPTPKWAS